MTHKDEQIIKNSVDLDIDLELLPEHLHCSTSTSCNTLTDFDKFTGFIVFNNTVLKLRKNRLDGVRTEYPAVNILHRPGQENGWNSSGWMLPPNSQLQSTGEWIDHQYAVLILIFPVFCFIVFIFSKTESCRTPF